MLLQVESPDRRGRGGQWVERAERVVHEARVHLAVAAHGPADLGLGLEQQDGPAAVGQEVGRDQSVGTGADHDGVVGHGRFSAM